MKHLKLMKRKRQPAQSPAATPKAQIPTMLAALRREREKARTFVDALESKLAPVLNQQSDVLAAVREDASEAAPVAQSLCESVDIFAALNARLKSIIRRVEL